MSIWASKVLYQKSQTGDVFVQRTSVEKPSYQALT